MKNSLYYYKAHVNEVYDGATITIEIDLGHHTFIKGEKITMNRINVPKMQGPNKTMGCKSRDFLCEKILGKEILIETIKDKKGKYGGYFGEIWFPEEDGEFTNINDLMVGQGYAEYKEG
jgi:micrococcal nuclease